MAYPKLYPASRLGVMAIAYFYASNHKTCGIGLSEVWREQQERAYFKLGNLMSAETQHSSLPNLKYTLSFCSGHTSNRLIRRHNTCVKSQSHTNHNLPEVM